MSRTSQAFERYQRINDLLNLRKGSQSFVTSKELTDELNIGLRQLRTDMEKMRNLGAPLEYVARERGWRYSRPFDFSESIPLSAEDIMQLRLATATLAQINEIPAFSGLTEVFEKIRLSVRRWVSREATAKAIYFDSIPTYQGSAHLAFFLRAIEETKQVLFQYQGFHASSPKNCKFDPYFLRQHNQRWYVGGFSHDPTELFIRTYPLDRVVGKPEFSGHYFDKPPNYHPPDYWRNIIGINRPAHSKVEKVVLEFNYLQGRYFLSKPFFEPFKILEKDSDRLVIELKLILDIEFMRRIAGLGSEVKVLEPMHLADEVQAFFRRALERYNLKTK